MEMKEKAYDYIFFESMFFPLQYFTLRLRVLMYIDLSWRVQFIWEYTDFINQRPRQQMHLNRLAILCAQLRRAAAEVTIKCGLQWFIWTTTMNLVRTVPWYDKYEETSNIDCNISMNNNEKWRLISQKPHFFIPSCPVSSYIVVKFTL